MRQVSISPQLQFAQLHLSVGAALWWLITRVMVKHAPIDLKETQDLCLLTLNHSL